MAPQSGPRRRAREHALQVLFSLDLNPSLSATQALAAFWRDFVREVGPYDADPDPSAPGAPGAIDREVPPDVITFTEQLVQGTMQNIAEIDAIVQRASRNWRLERMARVDRNVLRLATYELRFVPEVPGKVVINEAIEVAKRYGAAESPAFVNGLLDRISQELKRS